MLIRQYVNLKSATVALAQSLGLLGTLLFLTLLPDSVLLSVVEVLAFSGLVSATTASNNTAKVYTLLSKKHDASRLASISLQLFIFEQVFAQLMVSTMLFAALNLFVGFEVWELVMIASMSSMGALNAFTKYDDGVFVRFNLIKSAALVFRVLGVFGAVSFQVESAVVPVIVASFSLPFLYGLFLVGFDISRGRQLCDASENSKLLLLREYLWGIPVAMARALFSQGLILTAVNNLEPDGVRTFRYLTMPREILAKLFNSFLPIFFDRLFHSKVNILDQWKLITLSTIFALFWFGLGFLVFQFDLVNFPNFLVYCVLSTLNFSVLPMVWRQLQKSRAVFNAIATAFASVSAGLSYYLFTPASVSQIFSVMNLFMLCYVGGVAISYYFTENRVA